VKRIGAAPTPAQMRRSGSTRVRTPPQSIQRSRRQQYAATAVRTHGTTSSSGTPPGSASPTASADESGREWNVKWVRRRRPRSSRPASSGARYHQPASYFGRALDCRRQGQRLDVRRRALSSARAGSEIASFECRGSRIRSSATLPTKDSSYWMMVLNSTRLEDQNNTIYEVIGEPRRTPRRVLVKDLGRNAGPRPAHGSAPGIHRRLRTRAVIVGVRQWSRAVWFPRASSGAAREHHRGRRAVGV